ncbi:MAG: cobalt ECF transporter T component CbiQ [Planctomycetota bacterium]|nr:cobalt ECF transporter T component CbiQ [Planctomycetota bacterium]
MEHPLHGRGYRPPFDSPLHRLDARTKLLGTIAFVLVVVSTPALAWGAFAGYAVLLAVALAAGRVPAGYVLARWLVVLPFLAAAAAMPFLLTPDTHVLGLPLARAGLVVAWSVAVKATLAVCAMTLLAGSTHFFDCLAALNRLRAPQILVTITALAHRYVLILADEAHRMKRARDARGFGGRWLWQAGAVGRLAGSLFLRSYERGERVHAAMLARGFDGTNVVSGHAMRFCLPDLAAAAAWVALLTALRIGAFLWTSR